MAGGLPQVPGAAQKQKLCDVSERMSSIQSMEYSYKLDEVDAFRVCFAVILSFAIGWID
jgi:hypothetical protein